MSKILSTTITVRAAGTVWIVAITATVSIVNGAPSWRFSLAS